MLLRKDETIHLYWILAKVAKCTFIKAYFSRDERNLAKKLLELANQAEQIYIDHSPF